MIEPRTIDLNLLSVFQEVYRERQISSAARRLGLSQSAVSNALARLRRAFGDELFVGDLDVLVPRRVGGMRRGGGAGCERGQCRDTEEGTQNRGETMGCHMKVVGTHGDALAEVRRKHGSIEGAPRHGTKSRSH